MAQLFQGLAPAAWKRKSKSGRHYWSEGHWSGEGKYRYYERGHWTYGKD